LYHAKLEEMKILSESRALDRLKELKDGFRDIVRDRYQHKAKSCVTCETPGACCLDAHFVNVHISRLEAVAIRNVLDQMPEQQREAVYSRVEKCIDKYRLNEQADSFSKTYACPLYEKGTGCLVHNYGKPLPCLHHACYENAEDLPPDELLAEKEMQVDDLNKRTYGATAWLPLPTAIRPPN
jgi:hypothetical protein